MATFHRMTDASGETVVRCFVKGAPDQLLARAATVFDADAGPVPVDADVTQRYLAENQRLGEQGLRVMATARRDFDPAAFDPDGDLLPLVTDLELLALVGIVDPPRPAAKASIATAKAAGIRVRMITGDHAVTAAAIASQLGIDGTVITGAEFAAMTDTQALDVIDDVGVIARVTPEDKVRLVDLLQAQGPDRRHDRRRGQRRARAEAGRHRDRDGHHRHRGDQGSRGDDPDRRQLLHHRQGRRTRPRALRQPDQVHPVPDGLPVRLHRHLPGRQHPQHPRRGAVPAAADVVDQLHHPAVPGHRARATGNPPTG